MWARLDDNGHPAELIKEDPAGRFHPSLLFVPVPGELGEYIDGQYTWAEGGFAEPEQGYTQAKRLKMFGERFTAAVNARLDQFAREKGYDDMSKARLAALGSEFAADGAVANAAYDATWAAALPLFGTLGNRPLADEVDIALDELPELIWPE